MIFDIWDNLSSLHFSPQWDAVIAQVQILRKENLSEGTHDLCHGAYLNVMSFYGKKNNVYEAHRKFVDIHFVIKGSERINIVFVSDIEKGQIYNEGDFYQEDKDIIFYTGKYAPSACICLDDTCFLLAMPNDAHAPCLSNEFGQNDQFKNGDVSGINENFDRDENLVKGEKNLKGIVKIPIEWVHQGKG